MDAHKRGTGTAGTDGVERLEFPVGAIDGESTDRAFFVFAHSIRFIGGIQAGSGGIQAPGSSGSFPSRGRRRASTSRWRDSPERVDAATIARRQIHLGWQHIAERRTEGTDIGEQRSVGFHRSRLEQVIQEGCRPRNGH